MNVGVVVLVVDEKVVEIDILWPEKGPRLEKGPMGVVIVTCGVDSEVGQLTKAHLSSNAEAGKSLKAEAGKLKAMGFDENDSENVNEWNIVGSVLNVSMELNAT